MFDYTVRTVSPKKHRYWVNIHGESVSDYFRPFKGRFRGEQFNSDRPPQRQFKNSTSCKPFVNFVQKTLLQRIENGAISLLGKVGEVEPPYLILPLTVEPTEPRLCYDARFLNLWMEDKPFNLDKLIDLPRYVFKDSYQTFLDDKSGYDHLLLTDESRTFLVYNGEGATLPIIFCRLAGSCPLIVYYLIRLGYF